MITKALQRIASSLRSTFTGNCDCVRVLVEVCMCAKDRSGGRRRGRRRGRGRTGQRCRHRTQLPLSPFAAANGTACAATHNQNIGKLNVQWYDAMWIIEDSDFDSELVQWIKDAEDISDQEAVAWAAARAARGTGVARQQGWLAVHRLTAWWWPYRSALQEG